ncbi:HET-domain-containing protein [Stipitochalara longipes BDJ]|nr:HET-domain-containing protein [Stipitochalara longipes BDJ]
MLNYELFHVKVSELPSYRALSYTWGAASDPLHSVLINGQDFKVKENLWQALVHLQPKRGALLIWIDAICINQEDTRERNEQVRMMRTVYQTAEEVFVWLGLEEEDSYRAMQFLQNMDRCAGEYSLTLELFKAPDIGENLEALATLYDRDYWYRVWIVQEMVLANHIWVHCGNAFVSWSAFEKAWKFICRTSPRSEIAQICFGTSSAITFISIRTTTSGPMLIVETREQFKKRELGLLEIVSVNSLREASDPRDLIYGILGIVNVKASIEIGVDYSNSVARVYRDFAKLVILDSKRLDILLLVHNDGSNMEGLPSWVPDWSKALKRHMHLHRRSMLINRGLWDADRLRTPQCSFAGEDRFVVIAGLNIGCISRTRASAYKGEDDKLECIADTFFDWLSIINNTGGDMYENALALAEILAAGKYRSKGRYRSKLEALIGAFVRLAAQKPADSIDVRLKEYLRFNNELFESKDEIDVWKEVYISNASNCTWDRCLILSDSGSFGLAPGIAVEGDILCIPLGCMSPVILRPCEDYYTLIGEVRVHGFMHGEAITLLEKGELNVQNFELH